MDGLQVDPIAVLGLADAFEDQKAPTEALGTRLKQAAQPFDGGAADLNEQTRAVIDRMNTWFATAGETLEAIAAELDETVNKYLTTEAGAAADQQELLRRLESLARPSDPPSPPVS